MRVVLVFLLFKTGLQAHTDPQVPQHYHDFDFWVGKWYVYVVGSDQPRAQSYIESIIDSVGVLENYKLLQRPSTRFSGKPKRMETYVKPGLRAPMAAILGIRFLMECTRGRKNKKSF